MDALTLPATLDSLDAIGQYVKDAAETAGLDGKAAYNLRLAVDEIATNIVLYAYRDSGVGGDVTIRGELSDELLTITLEDTGTSFDPRERKAPDADDLSTPLEDRPIGGLGIFLVLRGVDEFSYERVDDRNRNIFVARRPAAPNEPQESNAVSR